MEPYIILQNVHKKIKNQTVLNDINLKLYKNKIYGFKGPNGSGKTMIFKAILGLIKIDSGNITVNKQIIRKDISFPQNTGFIIEYPGFVSSYSGFKNLKLLAMLNNNINDEKIKQTLIQVGLDPHDTRPFKKYSLGMKQRLGIAQAIMEDPELLILDEPTNALDEDGIQFVIELLKTLQNKTILIASHDKHFLSQLTEEIFTINNGTILFSEDKHL
ncbi:multidrug ABC transporter ATP-binding protein [Bacillus thuringiensis serovar medellin]|uniref:Multidrug ABC transporter ATP-binding protein n=1 Tax=Bacillus thuringiensis subsp. medellin TaxID=79672 RepID=A0A9X6N2U6_BACTV|nr:ATP-binding cassette domain-containing protein [Bacillus thuringiensis]OUB93543.1 multidrug ABC transporter ATP-binding protein [Bacillus thuringiensis serovar medellin]OUB94184.1 multidrug ABC transporter ATP-binding protein [Bacillus thuringiensis serovar medellin]OUC01038.1 multidrug ABC transporter ATP-binding protein [Bacillus thuringiensis serovar medellin]OUC01236.1 multidrug ABC transporter ATP-binding protein [Bacillus thuringiensis serovar medellin]OUC01240.1 multidrug ABC transpo